MHGNWVVEIGWRMPRIEAAGDICFKSSRPTQGCTANNDGDSILSTRQWTKSSNPVILTDTAEFYNIIYWGSEDFS